MSKEEEKEKFSTRKSRLKNTVNSMGKIPPQAVDLEEAVLGGVLLSPNELILIADVFKPEIFYSEAHQKICEAILSLHDNHKRVDILTVTAEMRKLETLEMCGGAYYITNLTNRVASTANIEFHIRIVYEKFLQREIIRLSTEKINEMYNDNADPFDAIVHLSNSLGVLMQKTISTHEVHLSSLAMDAIHDREQNPGIRENLGLSTGSRHLDKAIGGLQDEQLIIIGARPAMGKTAVALSIAKHVGMTLKAPVALFSLEMSASQLYTRFQTQVSEIASRKIKYNDLNNEEKQILFQADGELAEADIYIDDTPGLNIDQFRAKATIMKHKYGLKAILIDYLQLMSGSKGSFNREAEVSEISRKLKMVAKELGIPIVALCQLSRAVETRGGNKIPMLSDLRDSGSIEQDADTIMFLWRPEYYGHKDPVEFRHYNIDLDPKDLLAIIVAKQREGETMIIPLMLQLSTMKLTDHPALDVIPTFVDTSKKDVQASFFPPVEDPNKYVDPEDENDPPF